MSSAISRLRAELGELDDLGKAAAVLSWDQQTQMPPGGGAQRAQGAVHITHVGFNLGQLITTIAACRASSCATTNAPASSPPTSWPPERATVF